MFAFTCSVKTFENVETFILKVPLQMRKPSECIISDLWQNCILCNQNGGSLNVRKEGEQHIP
jgi:hypothetical protein